MQCVIRINDKTTHGGTVLEGSSGVKFMGLEVSCLISTVLPVCRVNPVICIR